MTGFNLPPGCSVSDIPGNRPEDEREEAFWDALTERCREDGEATARDLERLLGAPHNYERVIELARDIALAEGFAQGRDDERMEQGAREMERAERQQFEGERVDVSRLVKGDRVRAVNHGPLGTVVDGDAYGWTVVSYGGNSKDVPYKHGMDKLTLEVVA